MRLLHYFLALSGLSLSLAFAGCDDEPTSSGGGAGGLGGAGGQTTSDPSDASMALAPQIVMGWVPHYGIQPGLRALNATYGETKVLDTLNRIGLQFWTINVAGEVVNLSGASNEDVAPFLELARKHDIKVLLTVTNDAQSLNSPNSPSDEILRGFHWETVRRAFEAVGPQGVASSLLEVVKETDIDGIDLDFEAGGLLRYTAQDRSDFAALVSLLSEELKKQGKLLTVDTFSGTNQTLVPNASWWNDWQGQVDSLHVMGYENTYKNGRGDADYQDVQDRAVAAGFRAEQLLIGMPVWLNKWAGGGNNIGYTHQENIQHVAHCLKQSSGVALWALQHPEVHKIPGSDERPWTTNEPWAELKKLHQGQEQDLSFCDREAEQNNWIDNFFTPESNILGGRWFAATDFWDREDRDYASRVLSPDGSYDMARGEGTWGKLDQAYSEEDGRVFLSGIAEVNGPFVFDEAVSDSFAGVWTGCLWRVEALVGYDVSASAEMVVGMRCESGKKFALALDTKDGVLNQQGPWGIEVICSGEFENYRIPLENPMVLFSSEGQF
ncbi:MAG: glycosyl hydrolase family 18 protein, partial [Polyangiaceae bacterium]|nr:glycosyl hydrolase family 18 protein [Polyangiaceae bacterium]